MIFPLEEIVMKNRRIIFLLFLLLSLVSLPVSVFAQIPAKPEPPRLVNDLANIFTTEQCASLENCLVAFDDTTSNQIAIVTVNDLGGMDKAEFAYKIGQEWGVGSKKNNNGIVILVKPKIKNEKGEVYISVGYGLEGAIPDAIAKRIIEKEMIPRFREDDYYGGVKAAVDVLIPAALGEGYKGDNSDTDDGVVVIVSLFVIGLSFLVFFFLIYLIDISSDLILGNNKGRKKKRISFWVWLLLLFSSGGGRGHSSGGGFGGGSFGGGSFGGGFGGFGGGSFGGGGAGGSW